MKKLPDYWSWSRLGAEVSIREEKVDPGQFPEDEFLYIGLENIESDSGQLVPGLTRTRGKEIKSLKNVFKKGDILYGRLRPALNKVILAEDDGVCSTDIWVLQPSENLNSEFLAYYLRIKPVCEILAQSAVGGQLPRVSREAFSRVPLPLPPLPEQKRIVEILKQADALRRLRREILDQAKQLPTALFLEMFGDLNEHKSPYKRRPLGKLCKIVGGGTPATARKEFWSGNIPWVSPKDMKDIYVDDAEDHISEKAIEESATNLIPKGSVLVVTRSGILKHTFPVAITSVDVAINQDIKAILLPEEILAEFFAIQLLLFAPRLLAKVRIGATVHNIETEELKRLQIIVPPLKEQNEFVRRFRTMLDIEVESKSVLACLDTLTTASSAQAFSGELTESWREAHREELEAWLREHVEQLGKRPAKVKIETLAPAERKPPERPTRRWLMDQLSVIQNQVYLALHEWKGTLIPSADLDEFLSQWPVEHLEDAHEQLRRALDQLAGLGLIARVSLPTDSGDFVTGYRVLREEELSKPDDLERLGA